MAWYDDLPVVREVLVWRRRKRDPREVFTPKSVVTREMFAKRNEPDLQGNPGLQDRLRAALQDRGGQVVMYGDTGVGKSSLMKYAAEDDGLNVVSIECFSDRSYEQIIQDCIGRLIDFEEVLFTDSYGTEVQLQLAVGAPKLMTAKGATKATYGTTRTFEAIQKEPIEVLLAAMAATDRSIAVFDNFQNVDNERARKLMGQTMERLSDRSHETGDKKIVVIGIADDAPSLLARSGSVTRRTAEVGVPRMPGAELRQILGNGFRLLGLNAEEDVVGRLVFFSDGFPYFAHLLGQSTGLAARREESGEIDMGMVRAALSDAAGQVEEGYKSRVRLALEASGDVQPRKRLLELLAYDDKRLEWTSADAVRLFESTHGPREDTSFLHTALAQLTSEKHGSMLKRTGPAGSYIYKFNDPHMRPYLRLSTFPRIDT